MAPVKNAVQVQCRNCGTNNQSGSPHCARCGAPIADAVMQSAQQYQAGSQASPSTAPTGDPVVVFSTDGQDRALVKQTYERAKVILTQGEAIEYIATSSSGLGRAPDCAVATNKRVMLFRKKVLGKVELDDCWWRDVGSASLVEAKNGFNLKLDAIQGWHLMVENLPRAQANHLYGLAFNYAEHLQGQSRPLTAELIEHQPDSVHVLAQPSAVPTLLTTRSSNHSTPLPNLGAAPLITTSGLARSEHALDEKPAQAPAPVAPTPAFIPTPESVLQSILQNSALADLEEHGVPTRPMQWSAAAFHAPAMLDVQPVVLTGNNTPPPPPSNHNFQHSNNNTNTDTEPQMRPLPPLTTLERIAVFTPASGPLSLDSTPRLNPNSMPLSSMPLRESGALQSSPMLDPSALLGEWSDTSDLPTVQDDEPYSRLTDFATSLTNLEAVPIEIPEEKWSVEASATPWVAQPTGPISSGPLNEMSAADLSQSFTPVEAAVPVEEAVAEWSEPELQYEPEPMPAPVQQVAPVPAAPEPVQQSAPEVEMQAEPAFEVEMPSISFDDDHLQSGPLFDPASLNIRPTAPMGAEDYMLPMPGSTASGPLLAAAGDMDDAMEDMYRNTSPMSTQRLDYDAHPEDADLATRINLTMHNTPPNHMVPTRNSGGLNRTNTDELKASRTSSSRPSSSRAKADDPIAKMKQLKALLDAGLITEEDYTSKKADILARI